MCNTTVYSLITFRVLIFSQFLTRGEYLKIESMRNIPDLR